MLSIYKAQSPLNKLKSTEVIKPPTNNKSTQNNENNINSKKNESSKRNIAKELGLAVDHHGHYKIGIYYVTDYDSYRLIKHHMKKELNVFTNFNPLSCENNTRILFYENQQFKLCDVTNIKIYWNFRQSRQNEVLNEHCFILYIRNRGAFLFCAVKIEDKILILTLIMQYSAECATKIRLFSLKNKDGLIVEEEDDNSKENHLENKDHKEDEENNKVDNNIVFLHRKSMKQPNLPEFEPKESGNNSQVLKYRVLSVKYHDLLETEAYFATRPKSSTRNEKLSTHFDKVNILVTSEGMKITQRQKDNIHRFYWNNVVPNHLEKTRTFEMSFNNFLCHYEKKLLYLNKQLVAANISHDNFSLFDYKWESFCLRMEECTKEKEVIVCFTSNKRFQLFRRVYITALILFHFVMKIEELMNHSNTQKVLGEKLDRFILQNISNMSSRSQIVKDQKKDKFNNRYKVPTTQFRRPIYNGIAFLDDLKKKMNVKIEKKELPLFLKKGNNSENAMPSLEEIMGKKGQNNSGTFNINWRSQINKKSSGNTNPASKMSIQKSASQMGKINSSAPSNKPKNINKGSLQKNMFGGNMNNIETMKNDFKNTNVINHKNKYSNMYLSAYPNKKYKYVRKLAKEKAKKLTKKIFRNNNYMEVYYNRKHIQTDLTSKPLNQIMEEAGILL